MFNLETKFFLATANMFTKTLVTAFCEIYIYIYMRVCMCMFRLYSESIFLRVFL